MSSALETRIISELGWNWIDAQLSASTRTQGSFRKQLSFSSSGTPEVDGIWYCENVEVPALSSVTYNLQSLSQSIYGTEIPVSFASLCAMYICNRSETLPLVIANTGSSTASSVLTSSFVNVIVPPEGFFSLCNPSANWTITTSRNEIRLQNAFSTAISCDILFLGVKTASESAAENSEA